MKSANLSLIVLFLMVCASPVFAATTPAATGTAPSSHDLQLAFVLTCFFAGTWALQVIRR